MAARVAIECCIYSAPPVTPQLCSSATSRSQTISALKHREIRWRGGSSPSRSDETSCNFFVAVEDNSKPPRCRLFPRAGTSGSHGKRGDNFTVLAFRCARKQAFHFRDTRKFPVIREVQTSLEGRNLTKSRGKGDIGLIAQAEKKKRGGVSFGDQLLDYIEGGPKLRRWYGAPDQLPKDGGSRDTVEFEESSDEDTDVVRDVVLVTDADTDTGQLVVLELILRRLKVVALVKDLRAATVGFGAYVQPVEGDVNDRKTLKKIVKSARAIICPAKVGQLADQALVRGVEHLVLLSNLDVSRDQGGLRSLFGRRRKKEAEEKEAAVSSLGIPYTIIRAGSLNDERGGDSGFSYGQGGDVNGTIRREDAAYVCVEALDSPPQTGLIFEVVNGTDEVEDWSAVFASMREGPSG